MKGKQNNLKFPVWITVIGKEKPELEKTIHGRLMVYMILILPCFLTFE